MHTIKEIQEDLESLTTREERIEYLIDLGAELEAYPQEEKTPEHKVPGCVSGVYIKTREQPDNKILIQATSESLIVKGLVKIFLAFFNNKTREEIRTNKELFEDFVQQHNLAQSIVATRANAIGQMYVFLEQKIT